MRVLFVDLALKYVNPTRGLLPGLFSKCDTTIFGPGYVSSECLAQGISRYIRSRGPFDIIAVTEHIVFAELHSKDTKKLFSAYLNNYVFQFPLNELVVLRKLLDEIRSLPITKLAILLESDYYNFSDDQIRLLDGGFDLIVGWNNQFVAPVRELNDLGEESFSVHANDNWLNYVIRQSRKIIPLVHFVAETEFDYGAISHRDVVFSIPGTPYAARRQARAALKAAGGSAIPPRRWPLAGVLSRLGMRPFSWKWFLLYYQESFREEIRQARISFTCGSALRYPIRKYFEIPALGSILCCQPCNGFEELGFIDGVNAVVCHPLELPCVGRQLLADPERAQAIADAGRQMIGKNHTVEVRSRQLSDALRSAAAGRWFGARWRNGQIEPHAPNAVMEKP